MAVADEQQFCLRWNNFQANITSQFETLRDDEDFTDVTIACDGQRIQAHKVVLSACSPFFKDLFKSNPCSHPIIFMRDVEAHHIFALLEFMYAGEVNVAQTHLSTFLRTAESLKIRGLTDTSTNAENNENTLDAVPSKNSLEKLQNPSPNSTVTSSQDLPDAQLPNISSPPSKRPCKNDVELSHVQQGEACSFVNSGKTVQPKVEVPDYLSDADLDDDGRDDNENEHEDFQKFYGDQDVGELPGGMEIIPQSTTFAKEMKQELVNQGKDSRKLHSLDPRPCDECGKVYSNLSNLRQHMRLIHYPTYVQCNYCHKPFKTDLYLRRHIISAHGMRLRMRRSWEHLSPFSLPQQNNLTDEAPELSSILRNRREGERKNRLIKLAEGIEIYEDQLRSVKWSDYRKLTRGLATILFSPAELATCSVTGQRWSRAGNCERPVKPALDKAKVQAIISYVATRFPMIEISRIKQVLAYKCKENSTALKMKAVRYYGEQFHK